MNLKNLKNRAGFTLIELIVVIAIMAILAGVAVPVYSGYIEKAEKAADLQLLGAVNSAFAAAVVENGSDVHSISGAGATIDSDKTMGSVSAGDIDGTALNASFDRYFAGNETATFKVITALGFDSENGVFVDLATAEGNVMLSYRGAYVTVPAESVQAVQGSTFGEIGGEPLMNQVDSVSNLALLSILGGGTFADVVYDENGVYFTELADSLGMTPAELESTFADDSARNEFLANSLILSAAGATAGMDATTAINKLTNDPNTYISEIKENLKNPSTAQSALADAALIYGVYTSYVYSTDPDNAATKLSTVNGSAGLVQALTEMQGADFTTYMEQGSGEDDLEAYLEAMKVVNNATSDSSTKMDVLQNGFTDDELVNLMQGVLGK